MEYLSNNIIQNKKVILRCDFNVPVKDNKILDNSKIIKSLKTIKSLLEKDNTVIILSHFGKIKEENDKAKNSLRTVYEELQKYINLTFIEDPLKLDIINESNSKCYLVENTRYTDLTNLKESDNNLELSKYWSSFGDLFVIDAFASLHRAHSSTSGIAKYLPVYFGYLVEEEFKSLDIVVNNIDRPFAVIMGGAKVTDKIKIIKSLLNKCDKLILTGGILNTFLYAANKEVGKSLISTDENILKEVKELLNIHKDKIYFTNNFVVNRNGVILNVLLNDIQKEDIIYDNVPNIKEVLSDIHTIFVNGTPGKYEDKDYSFGTQKLLKDLADSNKTVIIGGGDTASSVKLFGLEDKFNYVSSGGGASLEYIAYHELSAIKWIEENK